MAAKKDTAPKTAAPAADKKAALETALAQIEKQFGKGAVMKLGANVTMQVDAIPTGSLGLDLALGIGGVPRGRIVEVYGPESSGKTTLALQILAEAQKMGGEVAFIDVEHALDPTYAAALGVDIDSLLVSQPDTGEQAMEICEALVRSGAIDAVVVDSAAAMVPALKSRVRWATATVGLQARLMSQALRKLTGRHRQDEHRLHLHQPAAREGRRCLRQPRGHHRRTRAEVLFQRADRRAPHRGPEGLHRRVHRQPHPR